MKYINLQQLESTCRIVLFAYKPPWRKKKEERGRGGRYAWQAYYLGKESAMTWFQEYTDTLQYLF